MTLEVVYGKPTLLLKFKNLGIFTISAFKEVNFGKHSEKISSKALLDKNAI